MKAISRVMAAHTLAATLILAFGLQARADWIRNGNTITDANGWVLKVEAKTINGVSGLSLPIDAVTTRGTPSDTLDLSGPLSDESVIVELNDYALRSSSAGTLYSVTPSDEGDYVQRQQQAVLASRRRSGHSVYPPVARDAERASRETRNT